MKHNWSDTPYRRYTLPTLVNQQNLHFNLRPIAWTTLDAQSQHLTTCKPKQLLSRQWSSASCVVSDQIYKPPYLCRSAYRSNLQLSACRSKPSKRVENILCKKFALVRNHESRGLYTKSNFYSVLLLNTGQKMSSALPQLSAMHCTWIWVCLSRYFRYLH